MSEHEEFQAGVPCWVDTLQPDPTSAVGFYAELFGWEVENRTASDSPRKYFVCKLRGRAVAGVGSRPSEGVPSNWNTYVRVDSVEEAAAKAVEAGGSVVLEPFARRHSARRRRQHRAWSHRSPHKGRRRSGRRFRSLVRTSERPDAPTGYASTTAFFPECRWSADRARNPSGVVARRSSARRRRNRFLRVAPAGKT